MRGQTKRVAVCIVLLCVALIVVSYKVLELSVSVDDMAREQRVLVESRDGLARVLVEVQRGGVDSLIARAEPKRPGGILYQTNEFTVDSVEGRRILIYREP